MCSGCPSEWGLGLASWLYLPSVEGCLNVSGRLLSTGHWVQCWCVWVLADPSPGDCSLVLCCYRVKMCEKQIAVSRAFNRRWQVSMLTCVCACVCV